MADEEEAQESAVDEGAEAPPSPSLLRSDAWTDLGLTLPIFVAYHLGVVFLSVRNAADPLTAKLRELANDSIASYIGLTLLIGAVFVGVLVALGRGKALSGKRFAVVAIEGCVYAAILRFVATYALRALPLASTDGAADGSQAFMGVIMSMGAGFYEEIAFRVLLFGTGAWIIKQLIDAGTAVFLKIVWAAVTGAIFSAWHYVGPYGDTFEARSFAYRAICGFVLALVYATRGFAPAVWAHALYDVYCLVL
ncbi:MAG: CPBP family intramembrane glutamic endopeptidase [Polyangiaceae bacterium]